ncbi:hypothetical protein [Spirosoma sp. KNUC1025]|uniref:hypothetical protein n=1 Tax=Spirosoma sp. KNUC1025 TaxID=2894082 RepID=UPI00386E9274|nr:hypothetical protein LN737_13905 [Spirosoma sp. KNUC1025]
MKKIILICLLLSSRLASAQQSPDIRQVRWGFSPAQVKQAETIKPSSTRSEKIIYARVPLVNRTVGLEYTFNGDSLLSASYYYYTTAVITQADVTTAAGELKALLTEKYGPGKTANVGEIQNTVWLTPRTQVNLSLGNVDKGWSLEIVYLCRVCSGEPVPPAANTWRPRKEVKDL